MNLSLGIEIISEMQLESLVEEAAELIASSKRILVFTGAGISTESGIPDFRSSSGLWTKYDPDLFTIQRFIADPESRKLVWRMLIEEFARAEPKPNPAHYAIVELDRLGKLGRVITQNVDELHEQAGLESSKVIHLHGTLRRAICLSCGRFYPMSRIRELISLGIEIPSCSCGGILKPDAVFFGEPLPFRALAQAYQEAQECDLCLVIGSSLMVYPAASIPEHALRHGAKLIIINLSPTHLDEAAAVCIHARAGQALPQIIQKVKLKLASREISDQADQSLRSRHKIFPNAKILDDQEIATGEPAGNGGASLQADPELSNSDCCSGNLPRNPIPIPDHHSTGIRVQADPARAFAGAPSQGRSAARSSRSLG